MLWQPKKPVKENRPIHVTIHLDTYAILLRICHESKYLPEDVVHYGIELFAAFKDIDLRPPRPLNQQPKRGGGPLRVSEILKGLTVEKRKGNVHNEKRS